MKKMPLFSLISAMSIFGTIGIFVNFIPFPSGFLATSRGVIGSLFVVLFLLISRRGINFSAIKKNLPLLLISGAFIGMNWMLLFEAYKKAGIPIATLCYYMSPLFVTFLSAIFFREKLTPKKIACVLVAVAGMFFVSGVIGGEIPKGSVLIGIILGLGAAIFYSCITLVNKKAKDISPLDMTAVQLFAAAVTIFPYSLICEDVSFVGVNFKAICFLIIVGVLHTGVAYIFYFTSVKHLPASKVAIFSYLDPILAILLSAIILKDDLNVFSSELSLFMVFFLVCL